MAEQNQEELEKALSTPPEPKKLIPRHKAFVEEYFRCNMNGAAAYSVVYPKAKRSACRINASKLLTNPNIREEIDRRLTEKVMSADEVLGRLSDMARASVFPFVRVTNEGFVYFNFSHPDAQQYFYLIKKIKTKRSRRLEGRGEDAELWEDEWVEVELHDAQAALEKIGKYHRLFVDRTENLNVDLTKLSTEQLERIAAGEDVSAVLLATTDTGAG